MSINKNYYEILGVDSSACLQELRKAFWKLSKELHPDTTLMEINEAKSRFQEVSEAFENLSDPELRRAYDLILNEKSSIDKNNLKKENYLSWNIKIKKSEIGYRRPLSSGEIFSLFILIMVILSCLIIAIVLALIAGKSLNTFPTWINL